MKTAPKILCVEDHADTCELVSTILSDFEVISVNSCSEALKRVDFENFWLHIFDYHLPDGTGIQLCRQIRSKGVSGPILFITGSSQLSLRDVRNAGGQEILRKGMPDFTDRLKRLVAEMCVS